MKKTLFILALAACTLVPALSSAQSVTFSTNLSVGSTNTAEVLKLQQFLVTQGLLSVAPTGNFLNLTKQAVIAFQTEQGLPATGFFGPLTQAKANQITVASAVPSATINTVSVTDTSSQTGAVVLSNQKNITWQTAGYPSGAGVTINLIRKVGDSPVSFVFVRQIGQNIPNSGSYTWTLQPTDTGANLYVEISCSQTYQFKGGCRVLTGPVPVN